jgi:serine/threonine protein phosphatase PrpC
MNMQVDTLFEKGTGHLNEDFCLIGNNLFGVFDGATSLTEQVYENGHTGGFLAARIASETFRKNNDSLVNLTQKANTAIAAAMTAREIDLDDKVQLWSTSAAVVRLHHDFFEWVQIGDCLIMIIYQDGTHRILIENFDHDFETLQIWQKASNTADNTILSALKDQIATVRRRTNISYGALNGENALSSFINSGTFDYQGIQHILIFTDGLFVPKKDPGDRDDFDHFSRLFQKGGLPHLKDVVRDIERSDVACREYPRFKPHDDIAAISLSF